MNVDKVFMTEVLCNNCLETPDSSWMLYQYDWNDQEYAPALHLLSGIGKDIQCQLVYMLVLNLFSKIKIKYISSVKIVIYIKL